MAQPSKSAKVAFIAACAIASTCTLAGVDIEDCERAWADSEATTLSCNLGYRLDSGERENLLETTSGLLQDLICNAAISMEKSELLKRLLQSDALALPRHPVACQISTISDPLDVDFTVQPVVTFSGARASSAEVNMADVAGIPPFLADLLTRFINESPQVEEAIVDAVNDALHGAP